MRFCQRWQHCGRTWHDLREKPAGIRIIRRQYPMNSLTDTHFRLEVEVVAHRRRADLLEQHNLVQYDWAAASL